LSLRATLFVMEVHTFRDYVEMEAS
jgi:hypothetical protein